nr:3361_t:CDS:2 [Entrophospora candida]CAG8479481.1 4948_t:CDS:2 [Entrophospora candida]
MVSNVLHPYYYRNFTYVIIKDTEKLYGTDIGKSFYNREFSFTLNGDVCSRYNSYNSVEELKKDIINKCPEKIDIGTIYTAMSSVLDSADMQGNTDGHTLSTSTYNQQ